MKITVEDVPVRSTIDARRLELDRNLPGALRRTLGSEPTRQLQAQMLLEEPVRCLLRLRLAD